jgi:DNA-binding MarR family transcriptional regulator
MPEPVTLSSSEQETWAAFYAMGRRLDRALDMQLQRDYGLSASEYEVLLAINLSPERQLRVTAIALAIGWEKSRVSHLVTRMEKRGLLTRTECPSDARGSWIGLTTSGRRSVLAAIRGHTRAVRQYFLDLLSPEDAAAIESLSGRVISAIGCGHDEDVA